MEIYNNILIFDTLSSTNEHAFKIIESNQVKEFTTIYTPNQTRGKGQRGNSWLSEPGLNCLFSIILFPKKIPANNQFILSQAVSVGLLHALQKYCNNIYIKWPNDIYINNKKIAGILIENILLGQNISKSVVGIGLNCNQTIFDESLPNQTSLSLETNKKYDCIEIINECIESIEKTYVNIDHAKNEIENTYHTALYKRNILAQYKDSNGIFDAKIIGVEPTGKLLLQDSYNQLRTYNFKEIEFL